MSKSKISKSDKIDKAEEARVRQALENPTHKCQHFAVGTFVTYEGKRYEVLRYMGDWVMLGPEGNSTYEVELHRPYFMG